MCSALHGEKGGESERQRRKEPTKKCQSCWWWQRANNSDGGPQKSFLNYSLGRLERRLAGKITCHKVGVAETKARYLPLTHSLTQSLTRCRLQPVPNPDFYTPFWAFLGHVHVQHLGQIHPLPRAALLLILALQAKFGVPLRQGVPLLAEVEVLWLQSLIL